MPSNLGFRSTVRVSRKPRKCEDCGRGIKVGDRYRDVVAFPWYDFNPRPGHYVRAAFCIGGLLH